MVAADLARLARNLADTARAGVVACAIRTSGITWRRATMAGPVRLELFGRLPDEDEKGRYRDTAGGQYGRIDIADLVVNLGGLIRTFEKKIPRFNYRHYAKTIFDDSEGALRCDPRPIDRYLDNYLSFTNFEALEQRRMGLHGLNRVVINATVTTKDNLSVRLWMKTLDDRGRWIQAPEWRDIPYYGQAAVMERPDDELLFIRSVDRLLVERVADHERYGRVEPNERKLVEASCELVNALFWLTVQRVAQRFEVALARYVVMLRDGRDGPILGIDIVDALAEHKKEMAKNIANFQAEAGWNAEEFWAACDSPSSPGRRYASESLVRRLRARDGGTVKLTAGEVDRRLQLLSKARAYGIWKPARGADPEKVVTLFPVTPNADPPQIAPPPAPKAEEAAKPAPALLPYLRRTFKPTPQTERASDKTPPTASRFDAPSYAGLRSAPWPDDLKREFAVESTEAFVAFVNNLRRAENRLPVPQGSFPAKASDLDKLVKEARLARGRQQQKPPDSGKSG
jgi:hypothetical protein